MDRRGVPFSRLRTRASPISSPAPAVDVNNAPKLLDIGSRQHREQMPKVLRDISRTRSRQKARPSTAARLRGSNNVSWHYHQDTLSSSKVRNRKRIRPSTASLGSLEKNSSKARRRRRKRASSAPVDIDLDSDIKSSSSQALAPLGLKKPGPNTLFPTLGKGTSLLASRTPEDVIPPLMERRGIKPVKAEDVFWVPSKKINAAVSFFEGGCYTSLDRWAAVRIAEASQLSEGVGINESSYLLRICADTLIRVTRPCLVAHKVDYRLATFIVRGLLLGVFGHMESPEATLAREAKKKCSPSRNRFLSEYEPPIPRAVPLKTVSDAMAAPSWVQAAIPLLKALEYEQQFLPQMHGWREIARKQREMEVNSINRATKSWQKTIMYVIFSRWHEALVEGKKARDKFVAFITRSNGREHFLAFAEWRRLTLIAKTELLSQELSDIHQQITLNKNSTRESEKAAVEKKEHIKILGNLADNLRKKCVREDAELRGPENDPSTLKLLAQSLSRACYALTRFSSGRVTKKRAYQIQQRDRDHVPMSMMLDDAGETERKYFLDAETAAVAIEEEDDDSDVVFPFELYSGMIALRWINYQIRHYENAVGKSAEPLPVSAESFLTSFSQLRTYHYESMALRVLSYEMKRIQQHPGKALILLDGDEVSSAAHKCAATVLAAARSVPPSPPGIASFIDPDNLVSEAEGVGPVDSELLSPSSAPSRLNPARSKSSTRKTANVLRVLYEGEMVDVQDPSEQLQFSMLAQIMEMFPSIDMLDDQEARRVEDTVSSEPCELLKNISEEEAAATKIQALHRGKSHRLQRQRENAAAAKIQALQRGKQSRIDSAHNDINGVVEKRLKTKAYLINSLKNEPRKAYRRIQAVLHRFEESVNIIATCESEEVGTKDVPTRSVNQAVARMALNMAHRDLIVVLRNIYRYGDIIGGLGHQILDEWHIAQESFESWRDSTAARTRLAWRSLCQIAMSQKKVVEEETDDGSFTRVSTRRVRDLFHGGSTVSGIDSKAAQSTEVEKVREVLKDNLGLISKIFFHFAGEGGAATSMNRSEFSRLVKDTNLKGGGEITSSNIDLIFAKVNAPMVDVLSMAKLKGKAKKARDRLNAKQASESERKSEDENDQGRVSNLSSDYDDDSEDIDYDENEKEIVPSEYVEALVRLAAGRYNKGGSLASRLEKLVEKNLRPVLGKVVDQTSFRSHLSEKVVQKFLSRKRRRLKEVFEFYAAKNQTDKGVETSDTIDIGECTTFCRDFKLGVPDRVIARLFVCAQNEEDDGKDETSLLDEKSELSYDEFLELLCALACWQKPDPYEPMLKKVTLFVASVLEKHDQINNVGSPSTRRKRKG